MSQLLEMDVPGQGTREQFVFLALPHRPEELAAKMKEEKDGEYSLIRPCRRGLFQSARGAALTLCQTFNALWAKALNSPVRGELTHWAMQHTDILPAPDWCDTLIDEMDRTGADVMSAVVPIKDHRGLTTTGVRNWDTGKIRRLTMAELFELPETFDLATAKEHGINDAEGEDVDALMVNTGLWVVRFDESWVEPPTFPGFSWTECVYRDPKTNSFQPGYLSEDWGFSAWAALQGLKVWATRKVPLAHLDARGKEYRNDHVWGEWKTEMGDRPML